MKYVALLRGINVGGNTPVDMKRLKAAFESAGMQSVRTYINSGNVLFQHEAEKDAALLTLLETAIEQEFGFHVQVLVKSMTEIEAVIAAVPPKWRNDQTMKCDVVFLWNTVSVGEALSQLRPREGIDEVRTVPGVIVWKVDRENATRNGLLKMVGTSLYKQVTVRNINTVRKFLEIVL